MSVSFSLHGCVAVITGASSGLGVEFARQLAGKATCLVLVARREAQLEEVAAALRQQSPALRVVCLAADLACEGGRAALWAVLAGQKIAPTLLVNNAGVGDYGDFAVAPHERLRGQIDLNITALTMLAREFVERVPAGPAAIINVASLAATLPIPDMAVYAATKAYVLSLSEALSVEFAQRRIAVSCVCPGPTPTSFGRNARRPGERDIDRSGQGLLRVPPESVVADALRALERGKTCVFPSLRVTLAASIFRLMPRPWMRFFIRLRYARGRQNP